MKIIGTIPNHILKLMPKETRAPMGKAGMTSDEADEKLRLKSEKQLQEQVANLLRQRNIWFDRSAMHKRTTGTIGKPDFLFAVEGNAIGIECKFGDGKLSDEQQKTHKAMLENGWNVFTVTQLNEVQVILDFATWKKL